MLLKPGASFVGHFSVGSLITGGIVAPDSLPTLVVTKGGASYALTDEAVTATSTGEYKVTGSVPADCPLASLISIRAVVVVSGVTLPSIPVGAIQVVPANVYDSLVAGSDYLKTDAREFAGDAFAPIRIGWFTDGIIPNYVPTASDWATGTAYAVGDIANDTLEGWFECLVAHTSGPAGSFEEDRIAHPTYWQAGPTTWIKLHSSASSTDDYYKNRLLFIVISNIPANLYHLARITAYNGTTKVASITPPLPAVPNSSVAYAILPTYYTEPPTAANVADAVCDEALSGHTISGTLGKQLTDTYAAVLAVGIVGTQVAYAPTSATRTIGTDEGGTFASLASHDDVNFATGEVSGTGLSVLVAVSSSTVGQIPAMLHVTGYYAGSASHYISVQVYNYSSSSWIEVGRMLNRSSAFDYTFPLTADNDDGSGAMQVRFVHNTGTYNPSHRLYLDWIAFDKQVTDSETASAIAAIKAQTDRIQFTGLNLVMADADASGLRSALGMAAADLDSQLDAILATGGSSGTGARTVLVTVNDGTDPLESVRVRYTKGAETYVASTNASGQATFHLDDGTWAVARTLPGYTAPATTLVVDGDKTPTYSMTAVTPTASDPGFITGYLYCYDEEGAVEQGVSLQLALYTPGSDAYGYDSRTRTATSDANGLVEFTNLFPGATYMLRRGNRKQWNANPDESYALAENVAQSWKKVTIPANASDPYALPALWGED